jgi:hypothetical protein
VSAVWETGLAESGTYDDKLAQAMISCILIGFADDPGWCIGYT